MSVASGLPWAITEFGLQPFAEGFHFFWNRKTGRHSFFSAAPDFSSPASILNSHNAHPIFFISPPNTFLFFHPIKNPFRNFVFTHINTPPRPRKNHITPQFFSCAHIVNRAVCLESVRKAFAFGRVDFDFFRLHFAIFRNRIPQFSDCIPQPAKKIARQLAARKVLPQFRINSGLDGGLGDVPKPREENSSPKNCADRQRKK